MLNCIDMDGQCAGYVRTDISFVIESFVLIPFFYLLLSTNNGFSSLGIFVALPFYLHVHLYFRRFFRFY